MLRKRPFKQKKYFILRGESLKFIFVIILIIALIYFLLKGNFFRIKKINCQINQTACHEEIRSKFSSFLNLGILWTDFSSATESLKGKHPSWESLKVTKILPNKIFIEITTFQPVAVLKENQEGKQTLYLVDPHGTLVEKRNTNPGLPEILMEEIGLPALGKTIEHASLLSALKLIDYFQVYQPDFKQILIEGEVIILTFEDFQAIFSPKENLQKQVTSLQLIVNEGRIDERDFQQVDLRFEKPVITYH